MKRFPYLLALLLAGAALMAPSATAADYTAYVGCSNTRDAEPATSCVLGDSPAAFFRSESAAVKYDVCVAFPSGDRLCSKDQEASQGTLYANKITTGLLGTHDVTWYVDEKPVATWKFELLPVPPPAVPAAPPAASAPAATATQPVTPAPSPACSREKQRVKRLLAKLSQAQGKEAKAKVRPKLKAARAAAKRLCSAT